jgi:anti-sigma B factor antagonist
MNGNLQRLEVERIGDATVVNFRGKKILDDQVIQAIGEQLFSLVEELGRGRMFLNFGNVKYLSSAALGKLVTLNKMVNNVGGQLVLCNINPQIEEVFAITKLNMLFSIQRFPDKNDPHGDCGGVGARLKPPKPSGGGYVALQPPPPPWDE